MQENTARIEKFNDYGTFRDYVLAPKKSKMEGDRIYRYERHFATRISWFFYNYLPFISGNTISIWSLVVLAAVLFSILLEPVSLSQHVWLQVMRLVLLYSITINDKIDGNLARARRNETQFGMYLDGVVHFFYPIIFYFVIASFFITFGIPGYWFMLTIALALITQQHLFFRETKIAIGHFISLNPIKPIDFIDRDTLPAKSRPNIVFRLVDYLTFMLYAWAIFYYIVATLLILHEIEWGVYLFMGHVAVALLVNSYKVFYSYPKYKLFKSDSPVAGGGNV